MPKKKYLKNVGVDFTINNYANATKPVTRIKKLTTEVVPYEILSWDQIDDEDFDVINTPDGVKNIVLKQKHTDNSEQDCLGNVYPEIVWYLISKFIKPEDVGRFATINKYTYNITKQESFWRHLYQKYCANHRKLPKRLRLENSYQQYGLRQRVIRALYHTYDVFTTPTKNYITEVNHHQLVKKQCVNIWYRKERSNWCVYFKFKKKRLNHSIQRDFVNELSRIDANPEEDTQVLQVKTSEKFCEKCEILGMTLCATNLGISHCFYQKLILEFTTGPYVSKDIMPQQRIVMDFVKNVNVYDWWDPHYPHFDNTLPSNLNDDESPPMLKKDFFN